MSKTISILTYNIRHGKGMDGLLSLKRTALVIKESGADLVGLQEVDKNLPRSFLCYQAAYLAALLKMHFVFGTASRWFHYFEFGNAILSKYPIIKYNNTLLPGKGEQRALLEVVVLIQKQPVRFFTTHLGLSDNARKQQVDKIIDYLEDFRLPTILTGDFNVLPADKIIKQLSYTFGSTGNAMDNLKTFPADAPEVKIDYIFLSPHWEQISLQIITSTASDHLPLLGKVKLFTTTPAND